MKSETQPVSRAEIERLWDSISEQTADPQETRPALGGDGRRAETAGHDQVETPSESLVPGGALGAVPYDRHPITQAELGHGPFQEGCPTLAGIE